MAGTKLGGQKAAETNKRLHGEGFYGKIGHLGGQRSKNGGFASDKVGPDGLTGRQRAKEVGKIGGEISSRRGIANGMSGYPR